MVVKKTTKVVKFKKAAKLKVIKPFTKSEIYDELANRVDLNKKNISAVFGGLNNIIAAHLKKGSLQISQKVKFTALDMVG